MGKIFKVLTSPLSLIDEGLGNFVSGVALTAIGVVTGNPALISAGVSRFSSAFDKGSGGGQPIQTSISRLFASIDPTANRKMVFGRTAMATDVRYQAFTGTDQEFYHQIVCVASHAVESIEELWLDQEQLWTSAGGVTGKFASYLTVTPVLEGSAANAINVDGIWNAANGCFLTGCAYLYIRYKRTGASQKADSPFATSISTRMTIVGKGCRVYDPRRDSTRGGSGPMRADDQTTWAWSSGAELGRNTALCDLTHKLGWRINGKLAVGCGMPPNRIDMARYIVAANACDETVTLAAGGTEPRYRFDSVLSEGDDRSAIFDAFKLNANALLRDAGGRIAFDVLVNDLALPRLTLTDDDFLEAVQWQPNPSLSEDRNIARGRYTDPRPSALYQLNDIPAITLTSPDGLDRILSLDLPTVQSPGQGQRILKQTLQRLKYPGTLSSVINARGWGLQIGDVVAVNFTALGFAGKLFRVLQLAISVDGRVPITLQEEHPSIYAWVNEDSAPVTLPSPTIYDWRNNPANTIGLADADPAAATKLTGIEPGADVTDNQPIVQRLNPLTGTAGGSFIADDGRSFAKIAASGSARDGVAVTFSPPLPDVPEIFFLPGGNSGTAGQNIKIVAEGLTVSGFTLRAKSQNVTPGSLITDGPSSAGGGGEPQLVINRSSALNPFNGTFTFNMTATVGTIGGGEPGYVQVGLFVKQSGSWNQVASIRRSTSGAFSRGVSPGTVDFGAGNEYGLSVIAEEGGSSAGFTSVTYTPGTVTETSLTPSGASDIPWIAVLP